MGQYRIYCLDGGNKIDSAEWIDAADDAAAIMEVKNRFPRHSCELWDGPRLVGRVNNGKGV